MINPNTTGLLMIPKVGANEARNSIYGPTPSNPDRRR